MIVPSLDQRLAMRTPPPGLHRAVQTWEEIILIHWQVPPAMLRNLVPESLEIDLHDGAAWISLVALTIRDASPALGIPLPWLSFFHQVNIRTYVQRDGFPGIWLLSADVDSQIMVSIARRIFHLPYFLAAFHETYRGGYRTWEMVRRRDAFPAELSLSWRSGEPVGETVPGTDDFFLLDRFCIYAADRGRLYRARIHHEPWSLRSGTVRKCRSSMLLALGLSEPQGEPLVHCPRTMPNVRVWPMEEVRVTLPEAV